MQAGRTDVMGRLPTEIGGLFQHQPWLWLVVAFAAVVWAGSIVLIWRSGKFRRKWLWTLLAVGAGVGWSWTFPSGDSFGMGIPAGALYVLGFWLWGPAPVGPPPPRPLKTATAAPEGLGWRAWLLRGAYAACAADCLVLAALAARGELMRHFLSAIPAEALGGDASFASFLNFISVGQAVEMVILSAVFVLLAVRTYWWGRFLCGLGALAWLMFGGVSLLLFPNVNWLLGVMLPSGLLMLATAVIHQVIDPRLTGPFLRRSA